MPNVSASSVQSLQLHHRGADGVLVQRDLDLSFLSRTGSCRCKYAVRGRMAYNQ